MDNGQWTCEDDESGTYVSPLYRSKTAFHSIGKNNGRHAMQVKDLPTRIEVKYVLIENSQRTLSTAEYFSGSASSVSEM